MAKGTIEVKLLGDNRDLSRALGESESKLASFASGVGRVALVAGAAIAAAAVAGAVKSTTAFAGFQSSMNEVFTLLPGISESAMDEMSGQVRNFSTEFGVLPDKVVPALYQALSAGVPQDNVFEFLETAQMAARGGVTELSTAVDGISSVVNAYGEDVVGAGEASDLMFTAVRLGKTTFEELSASLSNVTPIASGLGVEFEDVSAGLASLTAKGVPTAQATTQLRSLFVDLSRAGGETAAVFERTAGQSFQEFIAAGGDTADALDIMQQAADASGVQIQDLFGSVEAGSAALSLASDDSFRNNIDEMGNAAGATEAAFNQMMTGLGPIFDKIKANLAVFMINVGEKLAPIVERAIGRAIAVFGRLRAWFDANWPMINKTISRVVDYVKRTMAPVIESAVGLVVGAFGRLRAWFTANWPMINKTIARVVNYVKMEVLPVLRTVFDGIVAAGTTVVNFFAGNWDTIRSAITGTFQWMLDNKAVVVGAFVGVGVAVATFLVPPLIASAAASIAAAAPLYLLLAAVAAVSGGLVYAYQNFEGFRNVVDAVAQFLTGTVWPAIQSFATFIASAFGALVGFVRTHWNTIQSVISGVWNFIKSYVTNAINIVKGVIQTVTAVISGDWGKAWTAIKATLSAVWDQIKLLVSTGINLVKSVLSAAWPVIKSVLSAAWDAIKTKISDAWNAIKTKVSDAIESVKSTIGTKLSEIKTKFEAVWNGLKTFIGTTWDTIRTKVSSGIDSVVDFVAGLPGRVADGVGSGFSAIWENFKTYANKIVDGWNGLSFTLPSIDLGPLGSIGGGTVGTPNIPRFHSGGFVGNPSGPRRDIPIMAQQGEFVLSSNDVDALMSGGGSLGGVRVVINLMDRHQVEAIVSERDAELLAGLDGGLR